MCPVYQQWNQYQVQIVNNISHMDPTQSHPQPFPHHNQQPPAQNPFRVIQGDTLEHYREDLATQSLWIRPFASLRYQHFEQTLEEETQSYLGLQWLRQKYPYRLQSVTQVSGRKEYYVSQNGISLSRKLTAIEVEQYTLAKKYEAQITRINKLFLQIGLDRIVNQRQNTYLNTLNQRYERFTKDEKQFYSLFRNSSGFQFKRFYSVLDVRAEGEEDFALYFNGQMRRLLTKEEANYHSAMGYSNKQTQDFIQALKDKIKKQKKGEDMNNTNQSPKSRSNPTETNQTESKPMESNQAQNKSMESNPTESNQTESLSKSTENTFQQNCIQHSQRVDLAGDTVPSPQNKQEDAVSNTKQVDNRGQQMEVIQLKQDRNDQLTKEQQRLNDEQGKQSNKKSPSSQSSFAGYTENSDNSKDQHSKEWIQSNIGKVGSTESAIFATEQPSTEKSNKVNAQYIQRNIKEGQLKDVVKPNEYRINTVQVKHQEKIKELETQLSISAQINQQLKVQSSNANLEGLRVQNKLREQVHELEGKVKNAEERRHDTEKQLHNLIKSLETHHTETMNILRKEMEQRFEDQINTLKTKLEENEETLKREINARKSFAELFSKIESLKTDATALQNQKKKVIDITAKMNEMKVECDRRITMQTEEKSKIIRALEDNSRKMVKDKDRQIELLREELDKKNAAMKQSEIAITMLQQDHMRQMALKDRLLRESEAKRMADNEILSNFKEKIEQLEKERQIQFKKYFEEANALVLKAETNYNGALKREQQQMKKKADQAAASSLCEQRRLEQRLKQCSNLLKKTEGEGRSKQQYISMQSQQIERLTQERDTVAKEKQAKEKLLSEIEAMFPNDKQGSVDILGRINAQLKLRKKQIQSLNREKEEMSAANKTLSEQQHSNLGTVTSVRDSLQKNFSSLSAVCRDNKPGPNLRAEGDGTAIKVVFYEVLTICDRRFNQSTQQISQLRQEVSRQQTQKQKLDSEMKNLGITIVGLEQKKRDLDQSLRQETLRLRKQTQQLEKCRTQLSISSQNNENSNEKITLLNQAITNLNDQLRKAEQKITNIEDKLKKAVETLCEEKRSSQSLNRELSANITTLDDQLKASKNELVRAKQQLQYQATDLKDAEKQIEQLKNDQKKRNEMKTKMLELALQNTLKKWKELSPIDD